ncbi:MAG: hypothetical protein HKM28_05330 [Flavobacteriaceae bacterium]|jgi:hypothetical protein|nr:hypothetical protein [Flavobacteriaceae bacterium]
MKLFIYILIALAAGLLIFNITQLDFDNLLEGDSTIAAICVMASACTILLLLILLVSKKIDKRR